MTKKLRTNVPIKISSTGKQDDHAFLQHWTVLIYEFQLEGARGSARDFSPFLLPTAEVDIHGAFARLRHVHGAALSEAIETGLPATAAWGALESLGFTRSEIARVVDTSEKTIQRKERKSERLGVAEGDRTMRLMLIVVDAIDAIGDRDKALRWLRKPNRALGGKIPLDAVATESGAALVRQSLAAIAYGGVA